MAIRNAQALTFRAKGLSDAVDGTNAFPGAMSVLSNLVPSPATAQQFVPRPAATQVTNFAGFNTPTTVTCLFVIGTRAYGMVSSSRFAGKDEPFCYDLVNGAFVTITGQTAANCPTSPLTTGDWSPPQMAMIGSRIMIAHTGYDGVTHFVGWIDTRGFSSTSLTGSTHTSTLIDTLSADPITSGWQVGDTITGAGIPAGTTIVSLTSTSVILSQAAIASAAAVALTVTGGAFAAPTYGSGQTNGAPLAGVPVAVEQFNGRAWYAVANALQFSDALNPLQITNATQALVLGDTVAINALAGLPLANQVVGGVVQSLIAMKGDDLYYQITGDPATNTLASNAVAGSVGTLAPNTMVPTPLGLAYVAPDGLRFIGLDGKSSEPVGANGQGVNIPFYYAINPSRMCAAYNQNVLRISVQNGYANGQPFEEYWFDCNLKVWTGPHSFPASLISGYHQAVNAFILAAHGINAKLWKSDTVPLASSTYTENAAALDFVWQTCLLPDNEHGEANQVVQSTLGLALPPSQAINILAVNEASGTLSSVVLTGTGMGSTIWDTFAWGAAPWGGGISAFQQFQIAWPNQLVFKQMSVRINGPSQAGFVIGNLYAKYQVLRYQGAPS